MSVKMIGRNSGALLTSSLVTQNSGTGCRSKLMLLLGFCKNFTAALLLMQTSHGAAMTSFLASAFVAVKVPAYSGPSDIVLT